MSQELRKRLATRIKALCRAQNITPSRLAQRAGLSHSTMSYVLSLQQNPSLDWMARIADELGVTVADLLGDAEPKPRARR